jgi:hypothetical protein
LLNVRYIPTVLALLLGCNDGDGGQPTYHTQSGVPFVLKAGMDGTGPAEVGAAIDRRVCQWVAEKHEWSLGAYSDEMLFLVARRWPIHVYGTAYVVGDGRYAYAAYNLYGKRIEIVWAPDRAAYGPCQWDPESVAAGFEADLDPLFFLRHELKHSVLGDWHPE